MPSDYLRPVREADPVLRLLRNGALTIGLGAWSPSAVEEVSSLLARFVCLPQSYARAVAIALPRGRHQLASSIALYLAYARANDLLPIRGNVALATHDRDAKQMLGRIRATQGVAPEVRRLVTGPESRPMTGTIGARGISQADRQLLVHVPGFQPLLADNIISVSIVDAVSCNEDYWDSLRDWATHGLGRAQIFVGELGDAAFDQFCEKQGIPVWRWDYATLAAEGTAGKSNLALPALINRARSGPPTIGYRVCDDGEADEHLRELEQRFASMHRRSQSERPPDCVLIARRLTFLLGRLPLPLDAYSVSAVNEHRTLQPRKALAQVREAPKLRFLGRWAHLYETDWAAVRGALTQLFRYIEVEHPKYYEIIATTERARRERVRLVIRCGSRAEARALGPALVADGVISLDELLDPRSFISIGWFGSQSPPLEYGPADARVVTVLTEAPPPYRASIYSSAELGQVEAILYPTEAARLRRNATRAAGATNVGLGNAEVLAILMRQTIVPSGTPVMTVVTSLPSNGFTGRKPVRADEPLSDATSTMMDFFDQLEHLSDLGANDYVAGDKTGRGTDGDAVGQRLLVVTNERIGIFLEYVGSADVVLRDRLHQVPVRELRAGMRIALVDGGQRSGLLHRLMEAWDNAFGPARVFYDLYRNAFQCAYDKVGGTDQALGGALGVHSSTVRTWRTGENLAPQQDDVLLALLKLSGVQIAVDNGAKIRHYLARVRGMHRLIGRVFNDAAAEAAVSGDSDARNQLEALTGLDLRDFFDSVRVMTVERVVPADQIRQSLTGRFLPIDDPHVLKVLS